MPERFNIVVKDTKTVEWKKNTLPFSCIYCIFQFHSKNPEEAIIDNIKENSKTPFPLGLQLLSLPLVIRAAVIVSLFFFSPMDVASAPGTLTPEIRMMLALLPIPIRRRGGAAYYSA